MKAVLLLIVLNFLSFVANSAEPHQIQVEVIHNPEGNWQVKYQLPEATDKVYFYRVGSLPRDGWQLQNEQLKWFKTADGQDGIESVNGEPFTQVEVSFAADFRPTPKDYELNFAFSDGGILLYTGHLVLSLEPDAKVSHDFRFQTKQPNLIIVEGRVGNSQQQWVDHELLGTYVYFGEQKPIQSDQILGVIDAELPEWVKHRLADTLPKLFAFYTDRTGLELDFTPVVYFSYTKNDRPGTQYSGGTLPGLIQLNLSGNDWQQDTPENLHGLLHFLAHEAAHLWNSQLVNRDSQLESSWIHEGGADAFAVRALVHLGVWTQAQADAEHIKYMNACLDALNNHAITHHDGHQNFSVYYRCGATIAWLTEQAVKAKNERADLFDFWLNLMTRTKQAKLEITPVQYIKTLLLLTDNQANTANIITFLTEPQEQANDFMIQVMSTAGIQVQEQAKHPKQARVAAEKAFKHLMKIDCQGFSYHKGRQAIVVGKNLSCDHLQSGMSVTHIEDQNISSGGHEIFAKVLTRCTQQQPVRLQTQKQGEVEINCTEPPTPIRLWLDYVKPDS